MDFDFVNGLICCFTFIILIVFSILLHYWYDLDWSGALEVNHVVPRNLEIIIRLKRMKHVNGTSFSSYFSILSAYIDNANSFVVHCDIVKCFLNEKSHYFALPQLEWLMPVYGPLRFRREINNLEMVRVHENGHIWSYNWWGGPYDCYDYLEWSPHQHLQSLLCL